MKRVIGNVESKERDDIYRINEHLHGLEEMLMIISQDSNSTLYAEIIQDLEQTKHDYQQWWNVMSTQYNWENMKNGKWEIDFESCEIYLSYDE